VGILARTSAGIVGHWGFRRHFVKVGGVDQLVAEAGLWAIHPDMQHVGIGPASLQETNRLLTELAVPFGFTNCAPDRVRHHLAAGWRLVEGVPTRLCPPGRPRGSVTMKYPAVVLPVAARFEDWPAGGIDLNGPEL
jgi:nodulation protein A